MLSRIDRIQLLVADRAIAGARWHDLLGAEHDGDDRIECLGARRSRYRLGDSYVEMLEPDGVGVTSKALELRGPHLFAAGAATPDPDALLSRLKARGVEPVMESGQLYLDADATGGMGLRMVVNGDETHKPVGLIDYLYEVTLLVHDAPKTVASCVDLFGLDPSNFVPIGSERFGYEGTLTLFQPDRLHRFEIITPTNPQNTMGRYFGRFGESFYMAFAETSDLLSIEARAAARGDGITIDRPADRSGDLPADQAWIHPSALGGMMLGLSRPTMAWNWSGSPDRVAKISS